MKNKTKKILRSILKNLIHLKFKRMGIFSDKIGVSNHYLSRIIHSEKTYIHTLLEYLSVCEARITVSISNDNLSKNIIFTSSDAEEIAKQMGFICRDRILQRYDKISKFAIATNRNKDNLYTILGAKNKASTDHLFDLFEELKYKVEFTYELILKKKRVKMEEAIAVINDISVLSYIMSIQNAIERSDTFINAVDIEIMNLAKSTFSGIEVLNKTLQRVMTILEVRSEQDLVVTTKHIEVCKAIKNIAVSRIVSAMESDNVSLEPYLDGQMSSEISETSLSKQIDLIKDLLDE